MPPNKVQLIDLRNSLSEVVREIAAVVLSLAEEQEPEGPPELPPFPEGCDRFRMVAGKMEFKFATDSDDSGYEDWGSVDSIEIPLSRSDCANAAIRHFLFDKDRPMVSVHGKAARAWAEWGQS